MDNLIVCPEPLAAEAGQQVYAAGGNAIDAAVAAAFVQGVTNPLLCGIGGTAVLYFYDGKTRRDVSIDASASIGSVPVPEAWRREFRGRAETIGRFIVASEENQVGHQSVMIPGFVRGCWVAYQRFGSGKLSWAELLSPAIRLAREGFEVYPYIANFWQAAVGGDAGDAKPGYPGMMTKLHATPDAERFYLKEGRGYRTGEWLTQPDLANTLQRLADAGGDDFYTGEIAREIIADFAAHHGLFTAEDLRDFPVDFNPSISGHYRGYRLATPTFGGGIQVVEMLQILERCDAARLGHNTPGYIDVFARAQRAGFYDDAMMEGATPAEHQAIERFLLSPERADEWAGKINAGNRIHVRGGAIDPGTTHLTAVDDELNAVSFTHSIGSLAGSGVITPRLGFLYNNFLGHFNPMPGHPDSIEPGKKLGRVSPLIIFDGDEPYIAIGSPGGSRLVSSIAEVLANVIDFGMDMETAVSVPRFHSEEEQLVFLEPVFPEATAEALREMGNTAERSTYMARVQAIRVRRDEDRLEAGADPRGGAGVGRYP